MDEAKNQIGQFKVEAFLEKLNDVVHNREPLEDGALEGLTSENLSQIIENIKNLYTQKKVDLDYVIQCSIRLNSSLMETEELYKLYEEFKGVLTELMYGIIN